MSLLEVNGECGGLRLGGIVVAVQLRDDLVIGLLYARQSWQAGKIPASALSVAVQNQNSEV